MDKWPLLVWLAILGLVIFLYTQRGVQVRLNGMIAAHTEEISASEDGVIIELLVKEGEKVAGQELVKLDTALIEKEIEDYKANLPFIKADMQENSKQPNLILTLTFKGIRAQKANAQSRLEAAQQNVELVKKSLEQQLSLQSELDNAITRAEAITEELNIHNESIQSLSKDLEEAENLLSQLDNISVPEELFVLDQRLKNKTLVAPGEGTIHKINKLGGVTRLGEPILSINLTSPNNAKSKTVRA